MAEIAITKKNDTSYALECLEHFNLFFIMYIFRTQLGISTFLNIQITHDKALKHEEVA